VNQIHSNQLTKLDLLPLKSEFQPGSQEPINWLRVSTQIVNGDEDAFETYFNQFFPLMVSEARRITGRDEATCLDMVQNAMIKATKSMVQLNDEQHAIAWTRVLIRCTTLDWLRVKANRLPNSIEETAAATSVEQAAIDIQARILWVEEQLNQCPPQTRSMIALRYRLGWTLERIATRFGLKTGAVDGRIRRALDKIREQALQEDFE
jgi:RNA polymerase sigma factor (sigma-70 family)